MEENKFSEQRKTIIVSIVLIILIVIVILIINNRSAIENVATNTTNIEKDSSVQTEVNEATSSDNTSNESISNSSYDYYVDDKFFNGTYLEEHDIQYLTFSSDEYYEDFEVCKYMTYQEYSQYCDTWSLEKNYNEDNCSYIVCSSFYLENTGLSYVKLVDLEYENEKTILYVYERGYNSTKDTLKTYTIIIPTNNLSNEVEVVNCMKRAGLLEVEVKVNDYKPIIYLYPEEEIEVSVELGYSENITVSYPKYETGWNVLAKTDGNLTDLTTGRNLYSLYYESTNTYKFEVTNEGFIVKGEDVSEFLEEKLEILGLNERETEEFIIYWLPILQENEYNYIRFATTEEIEENMPLTINPNPDTVIRVLMTYKGLDGPIKVEEQELATPQRTGFVAVEWGGTEIE